MNILLSLISDNYLVKRSMGILLNVDKREIKENELGWFRHIMRRQKSEAVRIVIEINIEKRSRVRSI